VARIEGERVMRVENLARKYPATLITDIRKEWEVAWKNDFEDKLKEMNVETPFIMMPRSHSLHIDVSHHFTDGYRFSICFHLSMHPTVAAHIYAAAVKETAKWNQTKTTA
jgi:hypothetical protein